MRDQSPQSIHNPYQKDAGQRWRALVYLSIAELFALSLWFSATAVLPALSSEWQLSDSGRAGLTIAVQVGFIIGTLLSALGNLPDIYSPRVLRAISAAVNDDDAARVVLARLQPLDLPRRWRSRKRRAGSMGR